MSETDEVEEAIQRLAQSQDDGNLPAGTVVAGRFNVIRLLGMGAMGAVYLATQKSMDREVALKTLQHHSLKNEELLRRFYLEAKAASRLDHPNIVRIFDFGIDEELQIPFIAMEYLTGGDLSDVLLDRGPMPERDACRLLSQVAKALVDAHDKGIVHRDLKPDNIHVRRLTDGDQQCKVLDFGIAKVVQGGSESMANLTSTGMTMGTPLYMSPEQIHGEQVDFRTDLYSLGCILYEILSGSRPYDGEERLKVLLKHINDPIPDLPDMLVDGVAPTSAVRETVKCLMSKNFQERPGSTSAVSRVLEALGKGETVDVGVMLNSANASPNAPAMEPEVMSTAQAAVVAEAATMAAPSISEDAKLTEQGAGPLATNLLDEPTATDAMPGARAGGPPGVWVILAALLVAGGLGWFALKGGEEPASNAEPAAVTSAASEPEAPSNAVPAPPADKAPTVLNPAVEKPSPAAPSKAARSAASVVVAPDNPAALKLPPPPEAAVRPVVESRPKKASPAKIAAKPPRGPKVGGYKVRSGTLSKADLKKGLLGSAGKLRGCYKTGKESAPVTLRLMVKGDGSVGSVSVKPSSASDFKACASSVVKPLRFPPTPGTAFNAVEVVVGP